MSHVSRDSVQARGLCAAHGLYARRVAAHHGAPVLRIVGISDHRILCANFALWQSPGFHVLRGLPAPARNWSNSRLGAVALPFRRAWVGILRRHPLVRARRLASGIPSGLEYVYLQLWPQRGAQLSDVERDVLAGQVSRGWIASGCGGLDVISRLLATRARVDPEQVWRTREPRSD